MKLKGKIYINKVGQAFLPLKKALMKELNISTSVEVELDIENNKIIVDIL